MEGLLAWLKIIALTTPLEFFVVAGSFLEEIIAPIPSPLIMSFAGHLAQQRSENLLFFLFLAILGAVGKTLASFLLYELGNKAEDFLIGKFGKFVGLNHQKLEHIGHIFSSGWWDDALLLLVRTIPIIPTFIVSLACGVIKTKLRTFLWTTFVGSIIRNMLLLWIGAVGTPYVQKYWEQSGTELANDPVVVVSAVVGLMIGASIAILIKRYLASSPQT
jgi:membrane protein DedA with SNARE-associated domain